MQVSTLLEPRSRRYGGASADERREERRARIIEAAFQVFGDLGYQQVTQRLICAQARLADRYFHEHFDSVHACYQAVHDIACRDAAAVVQQAILAQPGELLVRARAGLKAFFEYIGSDPRRATILVKGFSASGLSAEYRVSQQYGDIVDLLRYRFRQRCGARADEIDIDHILTGCIGMVGHIAMLWIERGCKADVDAMVEHALCAWRGLDLWLTQLSGDSAPSSV